MQRAIQAIETDYGGTHFRSRLEARWAVFFDALKIPWEYEQYQYDLTESGYQGWYIPDFWIKWGYWIEIKGVIDETAHLKARALARNSGFPVYIFVGDIKPSIRAIKYSPGKSERITIRTEAKWAWSHATRMKLALTPVLSRSLKAAYKTAIEYVFEEPNPRCITTRDGDILTTCLHCGGWMRASMDYRFCYACRELAPAFEYAIKKELSPEQRAALKFKWQLRQREEMINAITTDLYSLLSDDLAAVRDLVLEAARETF